MLYAKIKNADDLRIFVIRNSTLPAISGVKRARMTVDEQQASVRVTFDSLTRWGWSKLLHNVLICT